MKIIGYSERGAMNALFYGMAHDKNGESAMKEFIKKADIIGDFSDFEIYNEFSLSEFGDPDMVIKAKNDKDEYTLFFIEAKASCGKTFNLIEQQKYHNEYMEDGKRHKDGHSSNLFFQLRLKHFFIERLREGTLKEKPDDNIQNRLEKSKGRFRKIGENVVVNKFVETIKDCKDNVYYIAIIPGEEKVDTQQYGFKTYLISWESIFETFKDYTSETILFNQNRDVNNKIVSQLLNNPVKTK